VIPRVKGERFARHIETRRPKIKPVPGAARLENQGVNGPASAVDHPASSRLTTLAV